MEKDISSDTQIITSDDKLISLIAHLSSIFGTIILPIILYFVYKTRSKFVAFNALQALYYQIVCIILFCIITFASVAALVGSGQLDKLNPKLYSAEWVIQELVIYGVMGLLIFLQGIYALIIGLKAYKGEISKYFIVGSIAYDSIYNIYDKTSFNLSSKTPPPTPDKKSCKGMI